MTFDSKVWSDEIFDACVEVIKEINPEKSKEEWEMFWNVLSSYKLLREMRAKEEK